MELYTGTASSRKDVIGRVAIVLRKERARATDIKSAVEKAGFNENEVNAIFGSMHGLTLEMVSDLSDGLIKPLGDSNRDRPVRDVLIEFGNGLADAYASSHLVALYRIALTEATRHTGIGRDFFDRGPGKLTVCLSKYLEEATHRTKRLRLLDPKLAADNFLSLLRDNLELSDGTPDPRIASPEGHNSAVVEAVNLFCHGVVSERH
jgi:hypothetical protein